MTAEPTTSSPVTGAVAGDAGGEAGADADIGAEADGLAVSNLSVRFRTRHGTVAALTGVSLTVPAGTVRTVVGESGSGKSVLAHALLGLLPANVDATGSARLVDRELIGADDAPLRRLRARHIAFVPQSPATALNPVRRLGPLLAELAVAKGIPRAEVQERLTATLASLGLDHADLARRYPHHLSGGMQQRVLTALALVGSPSLVVADEPTSGLDADRVADTAAQLRRHADNGASVLVITHDLALAERLGGRLTLLYAGHLMEDRPAAAFFARPAHPYGAGLLAALPERGGRPIAGLPPELTALPPGCPFAPRCPRADHHCDDGLPAPVATGHGHVRCLHHADG